MKTEWTLHDGVVNLRISGPFDLVELRTSLEQIREDAKLLPGGKLLWSDNCSSFKMTDAQRRELPGLLTPMFPRVAFVAPNPAHYGIGRVIEAITDESVMTFRVFRSMAEARSWLQTTDTE